MLERGFEPTIFYFSALNFVSFTVKLFRTQKKKSQKYVTLGWINVFEQYDSQKYDNVSQSL